MKKQFALILAAVGMFASCESTDSGTPFTGTYHWADTVYAFSSQWNTTSFSADQIKGTPTLWPDACECGGSWAAQSRDGQREYIEIGFTQHNAPASSIAIFENYGPGAVDSVYVQNGSGQWVAVWYGKPVQLTQDSTRIFVASFPTTAFNVERVRFTVASDSIIGWNEFDAVAISESILPANYDTSAGGHFHD